MVLAVPFLGFCCMRNLARAFLRLLGLGLLLRLIRP
jgi:hypothetical protein